MSLAFAYLGRMTLQTVFQGLLMMICQTHLEKVLGVQAKGLISRCFGIYAQFC